MAKELHIKGTRHDLYETLHASVRHVLGIKEESLEVLLLQLLSFFKRVLDLLDDAMKDAFNINTILG